MSEHGERFHVIFLRSGALLVSRKPYTDWREIQDEFDEDFMTSLGPWAAEQVVGFLHDQYGEDESRWPFPASEVEAFAASDSEVMSTGGA